MGKKTKSNEPKNNRNTLWILLAIGGAVLCIVNILLSCLFRGTDGSNIFTAISGWVSGIATILLGVLAVLQNKNYALASMKREVKDSIRTEQGKIVEIIENVTLYSDLKKPLRILVDNNVTQKDLVSYSLELEALREKFMATSCSLQLFNYIPSTMCSLVEKTTNMLMATYRQYQDATKHYSDDAALSEDFKNIFEFNLAWISTMIELRGKANEEMATLSKKVDNAKTVAELEVVLRNVEQQTITARNEVTALLDKRIIEEQGNG